MGQENVCDEIMLQRAGDSATRLLQHLAQHASGSQGNWNAPGADLAAPPVDEQGTAIMSLRNLIAALHKESDSR